MKVYLVWATGEEKNLLGIYSSMIAARRKVASFLFDEMAGYDGFLDELEECARDYGYSSISEFKEEMYKYSDYDNDFDIEIEEREVEN